MKHSVVRPAPDDFRAVLRESAALRAIYRAKTPAELDTLIAGMTNAQRTVVLEGLIRLAWFQLRKL